MLGILFVIDKSYQWIVKNKYNRSIIEAKTVIWCMIFDTTSIFDYISKYNITKFY